MDHSTPALLILLLLLVGPVLVYSRLAYKGKEIFIRRIKGIDAIDEAIGRAVELGRPASFTTGIDSVGPRLYACLSVLSHITRKAARLNSTVLVPLSDPEVMVLTESTMQNAYAAEGVSHKFDPSHLRYLSSDQFAFASGYMGLMHRENVASTFLLGRFAAESLILAEAGHQVGALQIAGTDSAEQVPFFISACDYTLIGEELYAAGAYLGNSPVQKGSLRGQDVGKMVLLTIVIIGTGLATYFSISGIQDPGYIQSFFQKSW